MLNNEIQISKGISMTIRRQIKRYNPEPRQREFCLDDTEFYSLKEIKDYCISEMDKYPYRNDMVLSVFVIMDTNEKITIMSQMVKHKDESGYYTVLYCDF